MAEERDALFYVQITLQFTGCIFNLIFFWFTLKSRVGTKISTVLMRCQSMLDAAILVYDASLKKIFKPPLVLSHDASLTVMNLYCYVVFLGVTYWCLVSMSVYSFVSQSIERFLCLCHPFWYRQHESKIMNGLLALILISPFMVEFPYCMVTSGVVERNQDNMTFYSCRTGGDNLKLVPRWVLQGFGVAWVTLFWLFPLFLIISLYGKIFCVLYNSQDKAVKAAKRLTLMMAIVAFAFLGFFALDSIFYFMFNVGIIVKRSEFLQVLDSFLVSMNSVVNPFVYFIFFTKFRKFIFKCGKDEDEMSSSQSAVTPPEKGNNEDDIYTQF